MKYLFSQNATPLVPPDDEKLRELLKTKGKVFETATSFSNRSTCTKTATYS
jgi:hypothetical protein